jgi:mono/diheme cytochrome c family protein
MNATQRQRRRPGAVSFAPWVIVAFASALAAPLAAQSSEWTIPSDAAQVKSPLSRTPSVLKQGQNIFKSRCQQCHGADGAGHGPASDPDHPAANLTEASNATDNFDGVLFYKVWNGRKPMPAFKTELTPNEVWSVIEYVKSLRKE